YINNTPIDKTVKKEKDIFEFMKAERTSAAKYDIYLHKRNATENEKPIKLQKTNRWVVTKGCKDEGYIIKYSKLRKDKSDNRSSVNMQKNRYLTLVNNVSLYPDINSLHIDYDFYISECVKIIKELKFRNATTHNVTLKQGFLF